MRTEFCMQHCSIAWKSNQFLSNIYCADNSMDKQELIKLVLVCALHGHDHALDAPWATQEGSTIALDILSSLAQALGCANEGMTLAQRQISLSGIGIDFTYDVGSPPHAQCTLFASPSQISLRSHGWLGLVQKHIHRTWQAGVKQFKDTSCVHSAGKRRKGEIAALAAVSVQEMLVQLIPGILSDLSAIIFPAQQQDKNARFQAYRGTILRLASMCMLVHASQEAWHFWNSPCFIASSCSAAALTRS